jgi:tetratricopeptide (TPR) repeat protein
MHQRHMESVQSSNRAILVVSATFAGVGFLCLILVSIVLMRAIGRFSEMAAVAPHHGPLLGSGQPVAALGPGAMIASHSSAAEEAANRFQSAIDQLQKRIVELEHGAQAGPSESARPRSNGDRASSPVKPTSESTTTTTVDIQPLLPEDELASTAIAETSSPASHASLLLGKGQALLNMDATEPALRCFEEVLVLEPNNAEAFVRKGMTLEKMQDWERALESYDRAIAADGSMTVAYLYRGGVCNRLQRYREALESYEKALQTEKKSKAS